jgi:hypothetical protein
MSAMALITSIEPVDPSLVWADTSVEIKDACSDANSFTLGKMAE